MPDIKIHHQSVINCELKASENFVEKNAITGIQKGIGFFRNRYFLPVKLSDISSPFFEIPKFLNGGLAGYLSDTNISQSVCYSIDGSIDFYTDYSVFIAIKKTDKRETPRYIITK